MKPCDELKNSAQDCLILVFMGWNSDNKKVCWESWSNICKSKEGGSLWEKSLEEFKVVMTLLFA